MPNLTSKTTDHHLIIQEGKTLYILQEKEANWEDTLTKKATQQKDGFYLYIALKINQLAYELNDKIQSGKEGYHIILNQTKEQTTYQYTNYQTLTTEHAAPHCTLQEVINIITSK